MMLVARKATAGTPIPTRPVAKPPKLLVRVEITPLAELANLPKDPIKNATAPLPLWYKAISTNVIVVPNVTKIGIALALTKLTKPFNP